MKDIYSKLMNWARGFWGKLTKPQQPLPKELPSIKDKSSSLVGGDRFASSRDESDRGTNDQENHGSDIGGPGISDGGLTELTKEHADKVRGGRSPYQPIQSGGHNEHDQGCEIPKSDEMGGKKEVKPRKVGGRRSRGTSKPVPPPHNPRLSYPELVCRQSSGESWGIFLTWDEDCTVSEVVHEGQHLNINNGECHIQDLTGSLAVSCADGRSFSVPLFESEPLVFKLRKDWLGLGRRTFSFPKGYLVAIAPDSWKRTGSRVPIEQEPCIDPDFAVHFFYRDSNTSDEDVGGFREWDRKTTTSIELSGRTIFDDSNEGDLFVGDVPVLCPSKDMAWARVGEEREGGWHGGNFKPNEQSLSEALDGREGRFFLRVYDSQPKLIDSIEFRYLRDLAELLVNGEAYTQDIAIPPSSDGNSTVNVQFLDSDRVPMIPSGHTDDVNASGSGLFESPANPNAKPMAYTFETDTGSVDVVVDVPRVWWGIESNSSMLDQWLDQPIDMTREKFVEYAKTEAALCIRSSKYDAIEVGFEGDEKKPFRRNIDEKFISVPFLDFAYHAQIRQKQDEAVCFNIEWAGSLIPVVSIVADLKPEVTLFEVKPDEISIGEKATLRWATKNIGEAAVAINPGLDSVKSEGTCEVKPKKTTNYTLVVSSGDDEGVVRKVTLMVGSPFNQAKPPVTSEVRTGGRWRKGKGFSEAEIESVGITIQPAVRRVISIDNRRKSFHPRNVEELRRMFDA